jgi:ribosome maturation factor RimP
MLDSIKEQLKIKIEEITRGFKLELIEFKLSAYGTKYTLRCLIDYPKGGVTVGECVEVNKLIFNFLEEDKLLGDDYVIEVNSPGLDRPLKVYNDFFRILGRNLKLWLLNPLEGRDYLEGVLIDLSPDFLFLKSEDKIYRIEFNNIKLGKEKVEI